MTRAAPPTRRLLLPITGSPPPPPSIKYYLLFTASTAAVIASFYFKTTETDDDDEKDSPPLNLTSSLSSFSSKPHPTGTNNNNNNKSIINPTHLPDIKSSFSPIQNFIKHTLLRLPYPIPRTLQPNDPLFDYPELKRGLRRRANDEMKLRALAQEAEMAGQKKDEKEIQKVFEKMNVIAYGEGVTPKKREEFLIKYGCTAWTDEILDSIIESTRGRGIVEIGAGNGQWARAITERYLQSTLPPNTPEENSNLHHYQSLQSTKRFEFVLPFDDKSSTPLSNDIYHPQTQAAYIHFHPNIRTASHIDAIRKWESRGRALLLVYPPPGSMVLETVKEYVSMGDDNDLVVYVGEGRGGANASDEFFDWILGNEEWMVLNVMDVGEVLGGKGYEKVFVLKRVSRSRRRS